MRVEGFTGSAIQRRKVILERDDDGIEIIITALPPSHADIVASHLPPPVPPPKGHPIRDAKGKILKDEFGKPVRPPDYDNPKYLKELSTYQNLATIAVVYQSIKDDPNIEFEEEESTHEKDGVLDGYGFYAAIRNEMEAFGLHMGDVDFIVKEVGKLTGITREDIDEAREDFLDQTETEEEMIEETD